MKYIFCILLLVLANNLPVLAASHKDNAAINKKNTHSSLVGKAYHIDFNVDTYGPITMNNIKKWGTVVLLNDKQMTLIEQIISSRQRDTNRHFDDLSVRLMLKKTESHTTIFVDQKGTVLIQGVQYSLAPGAIVRLNNYLNNLTKKN